MNEFHPSWGQLEQERRWKPLANESESVSGISLSKPESKEWNISGNVLLGKEINPESAFQ